MRSFCSASHSESPDDAWWSEWLALQNERILAIYLTTSHKPEQTDMAAMLTSLIEEVKPFMVAHGLAEQRARFLTRMVLIDFTKYRWYMFPEETVTICQMALEASEETGNLRNLFTSQFQAGFAHLWREELGEAKVLLEQALNTAEKMGVTINRLKALNYLTVVARMDREIDRVRELAPLCLEVAQSKQIPGYMAVAYGHLAWLAWREGDIPETLRLAEAGHKVSVPGVPINYLYQFPLLAAIVEVGDTNRAVELAQEYFDSQRKRLPDAVIDPLSEVLDQWDSGNPAAAGHALRLWLQVAEDSGYL